MEKKVRLKYLRLLAGILLIISGFTHVIQVFFVGTGRLTWGAVAFGIIYGIIGILLIYFNKNKIITLLCAILPIIGGILGVYRFIDSIIYENLINYFIIFHLIVDIIVVPICIYLYLKMKEKSE
jgi:uncharacterized membrane protein HdeD (DUF308 family)